MTPKLDEAPALPAQSREHPVSLRPPPLPRMELKLSPLARPPSPEELAALRAAVFAALGLSRSALPADPGPWRFSGRWWHGRAEGSGGFSPTVEKLWKN
jgi:hypothetical protein